MKKKVLLIVSIVTGVLLLVGGIIAYLYLKPPSEEEKSRYSQLITEGDKLVESREYSGAVEKYNQASKVIHTDDRAYSKIISIYLLKNDFDTALEVAQKGQNRILSSKAGELYGQIASAYFNNGQFGEAKINYEIAASLSDMPSINLGLAKTYVFKEDFNLAEKLLTKEYDSSTSDQAKLLYTYILGTESPEEAINIINEYTIVDSKNSSYFEEYESVLNSLDDDELYNITKLSRIYINGGYPTLAIRLLEPKIEDITEYVDALYYLGKAYLDTKQYDKAIETLLKSASLLGYESDKYWMLARAYYLFGDLVNATTYYDMAVGYMGDEITRDLSEEYLNMLLESNQTTKAQELYAELLSSVEEKGWLYLIGLELYYSSSEAKFDFYLDKLSQLDMSNEIKKEYLFWKIRKNLDEDDADSIDKDFETLLTLDRFNPKYYWLKGVYALSSSDTELAKNNFEIALEYDLDGEITKEVENLLAQLE